MVGLYLCLENVVSALIRHILLNMYIGGALIRLTLPHNALIRHYIYILLPYTAYKEEE